MQLQKDRCLNVQQLEDCRSGPGEVCRPIEGSFCTECEVKECKKIC